MKTKPAIQQTKAKPVPFTASKRDPAVYGRSPCTLPPCALKLYDLGNGMFRLPEGEYGDNSGGVRGRITRIRSYLQSMPITSHPSRPRLEEVMMSWGHPPERVDEIYRNLELSQAPESEPEELP